MRAEALRRRAATSVREAMDEAGDALLDPVGAEVEKKAEALVRKSDVGEDLCALCASARVLESDGLDEVDGGEDLCVSAPLRENLSHTARAVGKNRGGL